MSAFFALAALMSLGALALVLPALLRGMQPRNSVSRRAANALIHAAELDTLDHELASGRMTGEAHDAARDEVLRRVLAEGDADTTADAPPVGRAPAAAVALTIPLVAVALYFVVGNPGALTQSGNAAVSNASSVTVSGLEAHLRYAPRDGRAWMMLARLHMEADRYADAVRAYEQALASATRIANDAEAWCELADALGMAQGGTLDGRPRELIEKALAIAPDHPRALEMAGSAAYEARRYGEAVRYWTALLAQLPADSAAHRELSAAIARVRLAAAS